MTVHIGDLVRLLAQPTDLEGTTLALDCVGKVLPVKLLHPTNLETIRVDSWWWQEECYEPFEWRVGDKATMASTRIYTVVSVTDFSHNLILSFTNGDGATSLVAFPKQICRFVQPNGSSVDINVPFVPAKKYRIINAKKVPNEAT
jgi:hypothetical protein